MNILIIEDEASARKKLISFLNKYGLEFSVLSELSSVKEVIAYLKEGKKPDLIFADIELSDGNIFKAFNDINIPSPVVFITAYDQYALEAFQSNGIEYLLKPFSYERFEECIDKVTKIREDQDIIYLKVMQKFLANADLFQQNHKKRFIVKKLNNIHILLSEEISRFETRDGLIYAYNKNNERFNINENSLVELENKLNPLTFYRINRNIILNINYINKIEYYTKDSLAVFLKDHPEAFITSQKRTSGFKKWIDN